jgi:periplasmic protein CpxP/Spy
MKIHKTSLMVAAAVAGLLCAGPLVRAADATTPAKPQTPPPAGERGARARSQMDQLAQELNLTDAQKTQLKPIVEKERTKQMDKMRALRSDTSLSAEQRREKARALREESRKDLAPEFKKVLTPDQYEKWQKMPEGQRRGGPNAPKGAKGAGAQKP